MIECADCGCVVDRGLRLRACANAKCCCAQLPMQSMEMLAARVRDAMESADLTQIGVLLTPNARWGAPEQEVPTCRNSRQILTWYGAAKEKGVRAKVTDTVVIGEHIVVGLKMHSTDGSSNAPDGERWQVLTVADGRIDEIRGYETRGEATQFATSGVSHW